MQSVIELQLVAQRAVAITQTWPVGQSPSTPHSTHWWSAASQRLSAPPAQSVSLTHATHEPDAVSQWRALSPQSASDVQPVGRSSS
jgi:hypothetical protein